MKLTKLDADRYFINLCRANERIEIQYWIFTLALDFLLTDGVITTEEYRFLKTSADVVEFHSPIHNMFTLY